VDRTFVSLGKWEMSDLMSVVLLRKLHITELVSTVNASSTRVVAVNNIFFGNMLISGASFYSLRSIKPH
jgi:hypothetical protein